MLLKDNFNLATRLGKAASKEDDLSQTVAEDYSSVGGLIRSRYQIAKLAKAQEQEQIMLNAYRAWRGELSPEELAAVAQARQRMGAASSVFIKITKTKATAAYGQLCEILFANNKFPLGVEPTPNPEGIPETVTIVPEGVQFGEQVTDAYGFKGDGRDIPKGATSSSLITNLKSSLSGLIKGKKFIDGASPDHQQFPNIHPAQMAATNLEKVMQDQLAEGDGERILRKGAYECVLYGTGILKGPFSYNEIQPKWKLEEDDTVTYNPETKLIPKFSHVSVWDFYPDPDARNLDECEFVIERHLLSRSQLRQLQNRPKFNREAINMLLTESPTYVSEFWETAIGKSASTAGNHRYEVLEYWGNVDRELVEALGIEVPDSALNMVQINAWICGDYVLRLVLNPFQPNMLPYHVVTYEEHPHRMWGIGVPENMADTQMLMNGHIRMSIDNLRFAGSLVFEVNESQLVPGQDFTIFPGKVFRKQGGAPGQSVFGLQFPNTAQAHLQFFDKARMLADEATGIPSFAHGQTGAQSGIRSASQTSMLMSAAALSIKTVAKNFDELIMSVGNSLFRWNMQFNVKDKNIRGDVKIIAKGTASLMQREVVTQRLLSLLQIGGNPAVAPFLKMDEIIKEIVRNMDLDGDKFVNDPVTAKLFAESMGQTMPSTSVTNNMAPPTGEMPAPSPGDNTGNAPTPQAPGNPGFSGNPNAPA